MEDDYEFEKKYWGDCCNTFDEDQKHYIYANFMGLQQKHYSFDANDKRILDIGGGPSSMLLKCINLKEGRVIDPIEYPAWTVDRYNSHNISVAVQPGETFIKSKWDEAWIYNCLQHTVDPKKIIENALKCAPVLRIFEWIDVEAHDGHPHELTEKFFVDILGPGGGTVTLAAHGCYGRAFYGVFNGK